MSKYLFPTKDYRLWSGLYIGLSIGLWLLADLDSTPKILFTIYLSIKAIMMWWISNE